MNITHIVVDLDGTLIENGAPYIVIFKKLIFRNPILVLCSAIMFLFFGPNDFTSTSIAIHLDLLNLHNKAETLIKFNPQLISLLKQSNGKLILATGSDSCVANAIADSMKQHFDIEFDYVIASTNGYFCISSNKLEKVREIVESDFVYIGNSSQDYNLWKEQNVHMICVGDENFMAKAQSICKKHAIALLPADFELPKNILV